MSSASSSTKSRATIRFATFQWLETRRLCSGTPIADELPGPNAPTDSTDGSGVTVPVASDTVLPTISTSYNPTVGLYSLTYNGVAYINTTAPSYSSYTVLNLFTTKLDDTDRQESWPGTVSRSYNAATKTKTEDFGVATLTTVYTEMANGHGLSLSFTLTSKFTDRKIIGYNILPITIALPADGMVYAGQWSTNGTDGLAAVRSDYQGNALYISNDSPGVTRAVNIVQEGGTPATRANRLHIGTASLWGSGLGYVSDHPTVVLSPGQADQVNVSIRFAPSSMSTADALTDVIQTQNQTKPFILDWNDRRPILEDHPFSEGTPFFNVPTDPALFGAYQQGLLNYARTSIAAAIAANAQGIVFWDLEGPDQFKQGYAYAGDPRVIPLTNPLFNAIADQFFKLYTDAGLRVGVTIRNNSLIPKAGGGYEIGAVADPVAEYTAKMQYARSRWGCTLFYIDCADTADPTALEAVQKVVPDSLLMPELPFGGGTSYSRFSAPYRDSRNGFFGTPQEIKDVYPGAMSVTYFAGADITKYQTQLVDMVKKGEIILTQIGSIGQVTQFVTQAGTSYSTTGTPGVTTGTGTGTNTNTGSTGTGTGTNAGTGSTGTGTGTNTGTGSTGTGTGTNTGTGSTGTGTGTNTGTGSTGTGTGTNTGTGSTGTGTGTNTGTGSTGTGTGTNTGTGSTGTGTGTNTGTGSTGTGTGTNTGTGSTGTGTGTSTGTGSTGTGTGTNTGTGSTGTGTGTNTGTGSTGTGTGTNTGTGSTGTGTGTNTGTGSTGTGTGTNTGTGSTGTGSGTNTGTGSTGTGTGTNTGTGSTGTGTGTNTGTGSTGTGTGTNTGTGSTGTGTGTNTGTGSTGTGTGTNTGTGSTGTGTGSNTGTGSTGTGTGSNSGTGSTGTGTGSNTGTGSTGTGTGSNSGTGSTGTGTGSNTGTGSTGTGTGSNTGTGTTDPGTGSNTGTGSTGTDTGTNTGTGSTGTGTGTNTNTGSTGTDTGSNTTTGSTGTNDSTGSTGTGSTGTGSGTDTGTNTTTGSTGTGSGTDTGTNTNTGSTDTGSGSNASTGSTGDGTGSNGPTGSTGSTGDGTGTNTSTGSTGTDTGTNTTTGSTDDGSSGTGSGDDGSAGDGSAGDGSTGDGSTGTGDGSTGTGGGDTGAGGGGGSDVPVVTPPGTDGTDGSGETGSGTGGTDTTDTTPPPPPEIPWTMPASSTPSMPSLLTPAGLTPRLVRPMIRMAGAPIGWTIRPHVITVPTANAMLALNPFAMKLATPFSTTSITNEMLKSKKAA